MTMAYIEKSDKEIIKILEYSDNYEASYLIRSLKIKLANSRREVTRLNKKMTKLTRIRY